MVGLKKAQVAECKDLPNAETSDECMSTFGNKFPFLYAHGKDKDKVLLAVEAVQAVSDPEFKKAVVEVYDVPAKKLKWGKKSQIKESFPDLLDDPDVGERVAVILERIE